MAFIRIEIPEHGWYMAYQCRPEDKTLCMIILNGMDFPKFAQFRTTDTLYPDGDYFLNIEDKWNLKEKDIFASWEPSFWEYSRVECWKPLLLPEVKSQYLMQDIETYFQYDLSETKLITRNMIAEGYKKGLFKLRKSSEGWIYCELEDECFWLSCKQENSLEQYKAEVSEMEIIEQIYRLLERSRKLEYQLGKEEDYYQYYIKYMDLEHPTIYLDPYLRVLYWLEQNGIFCERTKKCKEKNE